MTTDTERARDVLEPEPLAESMVEMLMERIAELEFAQDDAGWAKLSAESSDLDLDKDTLRRIIRDSQVMFLKNPLIDHAVSVTSYYVFGQGVEVTHDEHPEDVTAFLDDTYNRKTFSGKQARTENDRQLSYEGNVFLALFGVKGSPTQVRRVPTLQIVDGDIIRNPEDDADVWLYKRVRSVDGKRIVTYHPDLNVVDGLPQTPKRPRSWTQGQDTGKVMWDAPIYHVRDGGLTGSKYGLPTTYSSLDWARAVTRDLSDYATVRRALARFAWSIIAKNRKTAVAIRDKLDTDTTSTARLDGNPPPPAGSAAVLTDGNTMAPIRTAGATSSPEEGRRLWLMVSAGTGIPETILSGNSDVGNYATAKTLDRPTELMMSSRQGIWQECYEALVMYDLKRLGRKPKDSAEVDFPDVLEQDVAARVASVVEAATLGGSSVSDTMPDDLLTRMLLSALGVDDIDEVLAQMEAEEDEEPEAPEPPALPFGQVPGQSPIPTADEEAFADALKAFRTTLAKPKT